MDDKLKEKLGGLASKANELKDKAHGFIHSDKVQDKISQANEYMATGKGREYLDKAKTVAGKVGDKLGDVGDKVKDKLSDVVSDATEGKGLFGFGEKK